MDIISQLTQEAKEQKSQTTPYELEIGSVKATVYIVKMSLEVQEELEAVVLSEKLSRAAKERLLRKKLLINCVVDAEDQPLFNDDNFESIDSWPLDVVRDLVTRIQVIGGIKVLDDDTADTSRAIVNGAKKKSEKARAS